MVEMQLWELSAACVYLFVGEKVGDMDVYKAEGRLHPVRSSILMIRTYVPTNIFISDPLATHYQLLHLNQVP